MIRVNFNFREISTFQSATLSLSVCLWLSLFLSLSLSLSSSVRPSLLHLSLHHSSPMLHIRRYSNTIPPSNAPPTTTFQRTRRPDPYWSCLHLSSTQQSSVAYTTLFQYSWECVHTDRLVTLSQCRLHVLIMQLNSVRLEYSKTPRISDVCDPTLVDNTPDDLQSRTHTANPILHVSMVPVIRLRFYRINSLTLTRTTNLFRSAIPATLLLAFLIIWTVSPLHHLCNPNQLALPAF